MAGLWQLCDPAALAWRAWDGRVVLYDERSGDTHYLDPLTAEVFETLAVAPCAVAALTTATARHLGLAEDADLAQAIAAALGRLSALDLVALSASPE